jgi:nucleotide-binding universal stress UspA family protein
MVAAERAGRPRIVVGADGSASSQAAFRWAVRQARLTGGEVLAVTAWHHPVAYGYPMPVAPLTGARDSAAGVLQTATAEIEQEPGEPVQITGTVVEGNAAQVLLTISRDADLLVVGNRGHGGFEEALLGSTGQRVVEHATCPVVVIRGDEQDHSDWNEAVRG